MDVFAWDGMVRAQGPVFPDSGQAAAATKYQAGKSKNQLRTQSALSIQAAVVRAVIVAARSNAVRKLRRRVCIPSRTPQMAGARKSKEKKGDIEIKGNAMHRLLM